jgi:hypothetical protein
MSTTTASPGTLTKLVSHTTINEAGADDDDIRAEEFAGY